MNRIQVWPCCNFNNNSRDDVTTHCIVRRVVPKPLTGCVFCCCFRFCWIKGKKNIYAITAYLWTLYFWSISPQTSGLAQRVHSYRNKQALIGGREHDKTELENKNPSASACFLAYWRLSQEKKQWWLKHWLRKEKRNEREVRDAKRQT